MSASNTRSCGVCGKAIGRDERAFSCPSCGKATCSGDYFRFLLKDSNDVVARANACRTCLTRLKSQSVRWKRVYIPAFLVFVVVSVALARTIMIAGKETVIEICSGGGVWTPELVFLVLIAVMFIALTPIRWLFTRSVRHAPKEISNEEVEEAAELSPALWELLESNGRRGT